MSQPLTILGMPILSFLTFFPTVGALALLFLPSTKTHAIRVTTLVVTLITFAASIPLFTAFQVAQRGMQFVEKAPWVPSLGIQYYLGVDGVSVLLILMTTFLSAIAVLSTFTAVTERVKPFMALLLVLETGMIGVFTALDPFWINIAPTTLVNAMLDPTDRSIPPLTMIIVMPSAPIATMTVWVKIVLKL
jgi:NADH-quinone oxidoreductase subunit M